MQTAPLAPSILQAAHRMPLFRDRRVHGHNELCENLQSLLPNYTRAAWLLILVPLRIQLRSRKSRNSVPNPQTQIEKFIGQHVAELAERARFIV